MIDQELKIISRSISSSAPERPPQYHKPGTSKISDTWTWLAHLLLNGMRGQQAGNSWQSPASKSYAPADGRNNLIRRPPPTAAITGPIIFPCYHIFAHISTREHQVFRPTRTHYAKHFHSILDKLPLQGPQFTRQYCRYHSAQKEPS